jgi:hypothetical protein
VSLGIAAAIAIVLDAAISAGLLWALTRAAVQDRSGQAAGQ